jgi:uncharacterized protein YjbI with pentapeptide repeats
MDFVAFLEDGRRDFLDAVGGSHAHLAATKPSSKAWSVLECIEHVIAVEDRYRSWIAEGTAVPPRRDSRKEMRLYMTIRSRLTKLETPDVLRPGRRFQTLSAAMMEFEATRDQSVELVREPGDRLYAIGARHPYFGALNGAELIQLIDGHARRHADQIRETCHALAAPREFHMKPTPKKSTAFRRDPPDLPSELDAARSIAAGESVVIRETRLSDVEAPELKIDEFRIDSSVLERVQLAGGRFGAVLWKDVQLVGCDLANVRAHRIALVRVEFIDCRLTGFAAAVPEWQDVLIRNGDVRYAQLPGGKFRSCEFDGCHWQDTDLQNGDLAGCVFRSCDLARADLRGTKLQQTDFLKSEVEGMLVGVNDLRGAIVDPAQAMVFAQVLGLQIQ